MSGNLKYESKGEVKVTGTIKDTEGNPLIKQEMRKRAMEMAFSKMAEEVPKADVIITNPIHISVAIRYSVDEGDEAAFLLLARINDNQPPGDAHLGRRQADAGSGIHGLHHVGCQRMNLSVNAGNIVGFPGQHRFRKDADFLE